MAAVCLESFHISLAQIESPCSYEDDEFGHPRRRGTHCSFLMRTASSPTPTNLAAEAENEDNGEAGNSNSELRRPTQGGNHTPCSSVSLQCKCLLKLLNLWSLLKYGPQVA